MEEDIEVNIKNYTKEELEDYILHDPLVLISIYNNYSSIEKYIKDNYLTYSIGIEVECNILNDSDTTVVKSILDKLPLVTYNIGYEQTFRIPNGLNGLICLYYISIILKTYYGMNLDSGIHYHVDITPYYDYINTDKYINKYKNLFLEELSTWNYTGTYNSKNFTLGRKFTWATVRNYKTIEFRIGEMTFEYDLLIKRILHLNKLVNQSVPNIIIRNYKDIISIDKIEIIENALSCNSRHLDALLSIKEDLSKEIEEEEKFLDDNGVDYEYAAKIFKNRKIKL